MRKDIKLPDLKTFTRQELAKRWKCDVSLIDSYIKKGQLREGFDTSGPDYSHLRELRYIVCADHKSIAKLIIEINEAERSEKWNEFEHSRIINCPDFVYMSSFDPREFLKPGMIDLFGKMFLEDCDDLVLSFCDLENNTLFPIKKTFSGFELVSVKKLNLEDMIIPLEEVLRFESGQPIGIKEEDVSTAVADRKEKSPKKEREDTSSPKAINNALDKRPLYDDRLIYIDEVRERVSKSTTTIYNWAKEGKFPKGRKDGGSRVWRKSEIDDYVAGRWKPTDGES